VTLFLICFTLIIISINYFWNQKVKEEVHGKIKAQRSLQKIDQRFKQLTENISEVFWIVSPDWLKVYYIRLAYERVWGRTEQDLYKNPFSWIDSVIPEDRRKLGEYIQKMTTSIFSEAAFPG
jgi:hypothetical protein